MLVVAKSGGTVVLYLPKEYFSPGDTVEFELDVKDGQVRIIAAKRLYNFGLNDIRKLTNQYDLTVEYDKELVDVLVFIAMRDGLSQLHAISPRSGRFGIRRALQKLPESGSGIVQACKRIRGRAEEKVRRDS